MLNDQLLFPEYSAQADYIDIENILKVTFDNDFYKSIRSQLLDKSPKLLVGPRGVGKTHQMRLALSESINDSTLPFTLYVTFNQYYHLEPLTKFTPNARQIFHVWGLSQIFDSIINYLNLTDNSNIIESIFKMVKFSREDLFDFESMAKKGIDPGDHILMRLIDIKLIISIINYVTESLGRRRSVILLDDAAMSLSNEYLFEFFEIFQALKTSKISPKASVYPGTTQYGPKFHARHDASFINAWLSVDDEAYKESMKGIFKSQLQNLTIPSDVIDLFVYASFGVPRALLGMIRSYYNIQGSATQRKINDVIDEQANLVLAEFDSLSYKVPQFKSIIRSGKDLFFKIIDIFPEENSKLKDSEEKQSQIGFVKDKDYQRPMIERMLSLMQEAGLIYKTTPVSHGVDREYDRYTPHYVNLIKAKAFGFSRGSSAKATVEFIERQAAKHPIRRRLKSLLGTETIEQLSPDLPPCQNCGHSRINEDQKFCHNCGSPLINRSIFEDFIRISIDELPLTPWLKRKVHEETQLKTIADFISAQDPASELRRASGIGPKRSVKVVEVVNSQITSFLS